MAGSSLHEDVTEDVQRDAALQEEHTRFSAAIDSLTHGLSMYDGELNLVVCNQRYCEIYGVPPELAKPGTPLKVMMAHREASGALPLEAEHNDFVEHVLEATRRQKTRVQIYRLANGRIVSVTQSPMQPGGFVALHQDITEDINRLEAARRGESELALQNMRFEAAVNHMGQGLCLFDREQRLVIANPAYQALYQLPAELLRPGTLHKDIVAYRLAHNMRPVSGAESFMPEDWRPREGETARARVVELSDGRLISIQHHETPDGGFVATHQDVTEEHRRITEIEVREREAALQNMRFDAAVSNIKQGLCMFDGEKRLVICNEAYARMYQLPEELTRRGTPLEDILQFRFSNKMGPLDGPNSYYDEHQRLMSTRGFGTHLVEQQDGRAVMINHHPTADGGWVATHEDITEQRLTEARVRHLARHDALTDLPNRFVFREEMDKAESHIKRGAMMAVLCIDLDHFKAVNDTLGHAVGDAVLIEVAARLRSAAREGDVVARLGGDEFALLAGTLDGPQAAATIANRIVKSMSLPIIVNDHQVMIGASVGITIAPHDGVDGETLLKKADLALYRAKSEGRGTYHFFEMGMDEALQRRRTLEQGLKLALSRGEFRLVYQPLLSLPDNRIVCFEALLRWDHPERGVVPPLEFIPLAEETGVIAAIGEWVLREACKAAATWPEHVRVAVNLSPVQFKNRALVNQVTSALSDAGVDPRRLELEITESLLLADTTSTIETLHRLRSLGVRIAMDDFGTGYSSLSYLRSFPFDKIKIDRSFMKGLRPEDDSTAIIKAIIGLGRSLGMSTTAEGIETEEQLAAVREQGCNEVQGFLFSPPLPASSLGALFAKSAQSEADTAAA